MLSGKLVIFTFATGLFCISPVQATISYSSLPYSGRADSPFFQSIQNGATYIEDFEDQLVNTPGLSLPGGRIFDSPVQSVDEDDGTINNVGIGRAWWVPNAAILPDGPPYSIQAIFSKDAAGKYPTHAGAVILGFTTLDVGDMRYFQAFDSNGDEILENPLTALKPVLPDNPGIYSTLGDRFFGVAHEAGISRIIMGSSQYFDHIQYGYGSIPEPKIPVLAAGGMLALMLRRRVARRCRI